MCAAPEIFFAKDSDGDGKADLKETLYTGFSEANPQHRVNGFEWGLDGWLYLAAGNHSNGEITSVKTGKKVETSGRDIRIDPHTGDVEAVSGPSQWCRCRDDFGNWYGNDNTWPLYQYVIEDRFLNRNPFVASPTPYVHLPTPAQSPPVYPTSQTEGRFNDLSTMNRFTSACGPAIGRNPRRGLTGVEAFVCEPVHNLISRLVIEQSGVEFSGHRTEGDSSSEFMSSTDNWFRPVRILSAPNNDLVWVIDMYRQVIEHPEWIPEAWQSSMDLYAGANFGRIYALREKGAAGSEDDSIPNLRKLSNEQLIARLLQPNGWQRDTAQQLLLERHHSGEDLSQTIRQLEGPTYDTSVPTATRIQSIWLLSQIEPQQADLTRLLGDENEDIVINSIRAFGLGPISDDETLMRALCAHVSARVRYQVGLALGALPAEKRLPLKALAVENLEDPWMRAAILSSSVGVAESILVEVCKRAEVSPARTKLVDGLIATAMGDDPESGIIAILDSLLLGTADVQPWQMAALVSALDNLKRKGGNLFKLTESSNSKGVKVLRKTFQTLGQLASDPTTRKNLPVAAIELLGHSFKNVEGVTDSLLAMLGPQYGIDFQSAAVASLGRIGNVEPLVKILKDAGPSLQSRIQTMLLKRIDWTQALVSGIEQSELSVDDLTPSTREILSEHRDDALKQRFADLLQQTSDTDRSDIVQQYRPALDFANSDRDLGVGRRLFETNCAACHKLGGIGRSVGPDLAGLQSKSFEYILAAIIDPNRAVEAKYRAYKIATEDGSFYSGMIIEESATSVKMAMADGSEFVVLRNEIEEMERSSKSFMPEGFEETITPVQMKELLAFINEALSGNSRE